MLQILKNAKLLSRCADYLTRQIESKFPLEDGGNVGGPSRSKTPDGSIAATKTVEAHPVVNRRQPSIVPVKPEESNFTIAVCGEEEVPEYHEAEITDILTCVSPERPVLRPNWPTLRNHLIVRCDDVEEPIEHYVCPTEEHVKQMIQFGREALQRSERGSTVRLLVHCAAGISRSTAATLLILAMKLGKGAEAAAMHHLTSIRPICRPNAVIVNHGDRLLEREGRLVHEVLLWRARYHTASKAA